LDQSAAPIDVDLKTRVEGRSIASNCYPIWRVTMIEELNELITDMQAICNAACDEDVVTEIATHAADLLGAVNAILPTTLNKRRCRDCGRVAYHADNVTPHVCCAKCGSQDTRLIRPRAVSAG